jgi:hypothetical protein
MEVGQVGRDGRKDGQMERGEVAAAFRELARPNQGSPSSESLARTYRRPIWTSTCAVEVSGGKEGRMGSW